MDLLKPSEFDYTTIRRPSTAPPLHKIELSDLHTFSTGAYDDLSLAYFDIPSATSSSSAESPFFWLPQGGPSASAETAVFHFNQDEDEQPPAHPKEYRSAKSRRETRISRPPNAWILYRSEVLADLKEANGHAAKTKTPQAELSKMIAEKWRAEPAAVKKRFELLAGQKKLEHEAQYPGYKFKPRRRVDKGSTSPPLGNAGNNKQRPRSASKRVASGMTAPRDSRTLSNSPPDISVFPSHLQQTDVLWSPEPPLILPFHDVALSAPASMPAISVSTFSEQPTVLQQDQDMTISAPEVRRFSIGNWLDFSQIEDAPFCQPEVPAAVQAEWNMAAIPFPTNEIGNVLHTETQLSEVYATQSFAQSATCFEAAPASYTFPPVQRQKDSSTSIASWTGALNEIASPALSSSEQPAWWPFRQVKVSRDEENGQTLEHFLQDLSEEAGQRYAHSIFSGAV